MKLIPIEYIKAHSRIEYDIEDQLLELYADSAQSVTLEYLGRSLEDIVEEYGDIPTPLRHAALMLVDFSYQQRSPMTTAQMHLVPYTYDFLITPYMKLV